MNLRLQTDYALRVLIYLASANEQVSVDAIADAYKISKDHLFKVIQQLTRLGYVSSRGGRGGGVKLAMDPAAINVGTVVGQLEGRNGVLACVQDTSVCVLEPGCVLRHLVIEAEDAFFNTLAKMTIADVLRGNDEKKVGGVYNLTINRKTPAVAPASLGQPSG